MKTGEVQPEQAQEIQDDDHGAFDHPHPFWEQDIVIGVVVAVVPLLIVGVAVPWCRKKLKLDVAHDMVMSKIRRKK